MFFAFIFCWVCRNIYRITKSKREISTILFQAWFRREKKLNSFFGMLFECEILMHFFWWPWTVGNIWFGHLNPAGGIPNDGGRGGCRRGGGMGGGGGGERNRGGERVGKVVTKEFQKCFRTKVTEEKWAKERNWKPHDVTARFSIPEFWFVSFSLSLSPLPPFPFSLYQTHFLKIIFTVRMCHWSHWGPDATGTRG